MGKNRQRQIGDGDESCERYNNNGRRWKRFRISLEKHFVTTCHRTTTTSSVTLAIHLLSLLLPPSPPSQVFQQKTRQQPRLSSNAFNLPTYWGDLLQLNINILWPHYSVRQFWKVLIWWMVMMRPCCCCSSTFFYPPSLERRCRCRSLGRKEELLFLVDWILLSGEEQFRQKAFLLQFVWFSFACVLSWSVIWRPP